MLTPPVEERQPQPALLGLLLHKAPEFIQLQHVTALARQERVLELGQSRQFPPPTQTIKVW